MISDGLNSSAAAAAAAAAATAAGDRDGGGRSSSLSGIDSYQRRISRFELIISTHSPVLESFLLHCSTETILQLYHTSRFLKDFFAATPTIWRYLSFRLPFPIGSPMPRAQLSPASDNVSPSPLPRLSRPYALDQLIESVVIPFSSCLRSLDLDNTAVFGLSLMTVLTLRCGTLQHLSIRGCKNVSLKYHIVPFLTMFALQYDRQTGRRMGPSSRKPLALKSLYTYRCRHHRRRPYLSDSLHKKDSDSEPTHELVNLCHTLGIWTDTAWCTTPAGRCYRRQNYVSQRGASVNSEVYVVFDRLWRSRNWLGRTDPNDTNDTHDSDCHRAHKDGRIWDTEEDGYQGEALGTDSDDVHGQEGKAMPTHMRRTHRFFVEDIKCDQCDEIITERCEQCSVMMHCVGCRKTLCHSCAFDRPYPRRQKSVDPDPELWWAPDAPISPCLMREIAPDTSQILNLMDQPPSLQFHWCCTQPTFSGGGGITTGSPGRDDDRLRAVPLPKGKGWENPEFTADWTYTLPCHMARDSQDTRHGPSSCHQQSMRWLLGPPGHQPSFCPRNLCNDCYESPNWKVSCKNCLKPLCVEHDLRGLRLRICGYRDLATEKMQIDNRVWTAGFRRASESTFRRAAQSSASHISPITPGLRSTIDARGGVQSGGASSSSDSTQGMGDMRDEIEARTSASESERSTRSSSPSSLYEASGNEVSTWTGCHSFFCPQIRDTGDRRERCDIMLFECTSCKVLVCEHCHIANPPCECTYCQDNYTCPNCYPAKLADGSCRRVAEENAKIEAEERHARMLAQTGVESILLGAMERRLFLKRQTSGRPFQDDQQLGSFLFNPFLDSEDDEVEQDMFDATYGAMAYELEQGSGNFGNDIPDPGVGRAPLSPDDAE